MDSRDLLIPFISDNQIEDKSIIVESKNTSSKYIFHSLKETESHFLNNTNDFKEPNSFPKKCHSEDLKSIYYAAEANRRALKCLLPFDCGIVNSDPTVNYSWGLTCGACDVFLNDRTQANELNGIYAITPICYACICDTLLWCPVLSVSTCCGFLVGGSIDIFNCCYSPKVNTPSPEEMNECIAVESPRRQVMN
ncbi:MAG: hypothetical protein JO131_00005 [Gammaproteobacteria bacterium]|nr:hypothetical protein [Gammaproteobacteria bacterium]